MSPASQYTDTSRSYSPSIHGSSFSRPLSRANSPPLPTFDLNEFFGELMSAGVDPVHGPSAFVAPAPAAVAPSTKPKTGALFPPFRHTFLIFSSAQRKAKGKAKDDDDDPPRIKITRQMSVDRLILITSAPPTWTVIRDDAAYLLNVTATPEALVKNGKPRSIDAYMKAEVRDVSAS